MPNLDDLRQLYPLTEVQAEFDLIERLGYTVVSSEDQCLIWNGRDLIIDADFRDNFYDNAIEAIYSFWNSH